MSTIETVLIDYLLTVYPLNYEIVIRFAVILRECFILEMQGFTAVRRLATSPVVRMGVERGTFTNQGVKGIAILERQPLELKSYQEWFKTFKFIPRWFRRFNESWWKIVPCK